MTVSTLLSIIRRTIRKSQPRAMVHIDVFSPNDNRAVIVRFGK